MAEARPIATRVIVVNHCPAWTLPLELRFHASPLTTDRIESH
jgi:hypothetical protein